MPAKKGVIFVLHGRQDHIVKTNIAAIEQAARAVSVPFAIGFLEGKHQTLEDSIAKLVAKGCQEFIFLPVLLFAATHVKVELPMRAGAVLPKEAIATYLEPLGTTHAVLRFLAEQLAAQPKLLPQSVLLIAHGTPHFLEPYAQLAEIAQKLTLISGRKVYPANYHGEHLYTAVLNQIPTPLIVQRLFLTEGFLPTKIKQDIVTKRGTKDTILPTLADSPAVVAAILERLADSNVTDHA
ncbi:hypothetical protein JZO76_01265 [Enterococcus sp. MJM12]|uniref:Cobalamin biosynthesis protein CbiX n=1 Tax=Candidatus Enterococcus myersii TaxID=2815322 RepID=A0ABS3H409_9ENTE|nr:hypothetical protein [Enterococcus sp. MJM12]